MDDKCRHDVSHDYRLCGVQTVEVRILTIDVRELLLAPYTQSQPEVVLVLERLHLTLPAEPSPPHCFLADLDGYAPSASIT